MVFEISEQQRRGAEAAGMLILCPFDPWLTIIGVRFRRIEIDALQMAVIMPRPVCLSFRGASSSAQKGGETKYRKPNGLDSKSARYREEAEKYDYNKEKVDYFEIWYACMCRERFGRINVVRPTIQLQRTPLSLHFQMFQRTKDYIIAQECSEPQRYSTLPSRAEHWALGESPPAEEIKKEHAFPMPRPGDKGGTDTSTIWGKLLLRDILLITTNDLDIRWQSTVLGPGGQDGTVHLGNLSSINGLVELSNIQKYGLWHRETMQRRARVPGDGRRQKTHLFSCQIIRDNLSAASAIFILIHHHPLIRNVAICHDDQLIMDACRDNAYLSNIGINTLLSERQDERTNGIFEVVLRSVIPSFKPPSIKKKRFAVIQSHRSVTMQLWILSPKMFKGCTGSGGLSCLKIVCAEWRALIVDFSLSLFFVTIANVRLPTLACTNVADLPVFRRENQIVLCQWWEGFAEMNSNSLEEWNSNYEARVHIDPDWCQYWASNIAMLFPSFFTLRANVAKDQNRLRMGTENMNCVMFGANEERYQQDKKGTIGLSVLERMYMRLATYVLLHVIKYVKNKHEICFILTGKNSGYMCQIIMWSSDTMRK
ncbi:hypothetical protein EV421DRAFT_1938011 [Armillaria borealis]|uniref:Uncharacterized protein n=1 Tax=Armillaria borealis TaxID=47425 RepID=A0AA39ME26_9AGAR|nr:hypothetical protein EV421DRAFT_1938011 [Armillaria borealis]